MKKLIVSLLAAGAVAGAAATPAAAAPESPAKTCAALAASNPELFGFIGTKPGACQSTVASVGLEALMQGAFPSNAAAVGNCKTLEATMFQAYTPEDGRAYPYQFYHFVPGLPAEIRSQLYARNRADCVRVLKRIHGGLLGGPPA
jgi:hypothetical protein